METGSIVEWLKHPGEFVRQGEQLLIIQSDKAANEIEALESATFTFRLILLHLGLRCP